MARLKRRVIDGKVYKVRTYRDQKPKKFGGVRPADPTVRHEAYRNLHFPRPERIAL